MTNVASFKADMQLVQSSQIPLDQLVASTDPLAVKLLNALEILHTWAGMFMRMIERFESRGYAHFDTSANTSSNVNEAFEHLFTQCLDQFIEDKRKFGL